tara:strand:- start:215 stop:739 length:525 start_codon:yes stop_codon:yes gene_type:complete
MTTALLLSLLGIPSALPRAFGNPRVRENVAIIQRGIREGATNRQIQSLIATSQGRGIRNIDLSQAVNYFKGVEQSNQNVRFIPRNARFNPERVPIHFRPMPQRYMATMRVSSLDSFTGESIEKHFSIRFDDVLTPAEMQDLAEEAFNQDINQTYNARVESYQSSLQVGLVQRGF